jgi:hypothetical protein
MQEGLPAAGSLEREVKNHSYIHIQPVTHFLWIRLLDASTKFQKHQK